MYNDTEVALKLIWDGKGIISGTTGWREVVQALNEIYTFRSPEKPKNIENTCSGFSEDDKFPSPHSTLH